MNPQTVAVWVVKAGWSGTDAITATSVALAGSGDTSPTGLFGLGSAGDGYAQAVAAHDAWSARGWGIFPNYSNGRWRLFVPIATPVVAAAAVAGSAPVQTAVAGAQTASNAATATAQAAAQAGHALAFLSSPDAWQRILKITIGTALVVGGGLYMGKRATFDQGVRFLRFAGEHASEIMFGRSLAAGGTRSASNAAAAGAAKTATPAAPKKRVPRARSGQAAKAASTHTPPPRHAAPKLGRPNVAAASHQVKNDPAWSNAPTQAHKVVGTAKRPASTGRKLPGESTPPRTGMWKGAT